MAAPTTSSRQPRTRAARTRKPGAPAPAPAPAPVLDSVTLVVSVNDANTILEGLQELPHKRSHHIIQNVMLQAAEQMQAQTAAEANPEGSGPTDSAVSP